MTKSSEAPGFYKKKPSERLSFVKEFAGLTEDELLILNLYTFELEKKINIFTFAFLQ